MEIAQVLYFIPVGDLDCRRGRKKSAPQSSPNIYPSLSSIEGEIANEMQVFNKWKFLSSRITDKDASILLDEDDFVVV